MEPNINTLDRRSKEPTCVCVFAVHVTFLSCFHTSHEVVALVPAVVFVRVVQRHPHSLVLVPLVPHIGSFDGVLDALLLGSQTTGAAPACRATPSQQCNKNLTFLFGDLHPSFSINYLFNFEKKCNIRNLPIFISS